MTAKTKLVLGASLVLSFVLVCAVISFKWGEKSVETNNVKPAKERPVSIKKDRFEGKLKEEAPAFDPSKKMGWTVWGKVTTTLKEPIEGVKVTLRFYDGVKYYDPLPSVTTDKKGRYIAFVAAPEPICLCSPKMQHPGEIYIEAVLKGFRLGTDFMIDLPYPKVNSDSVRQDVFLKEGELFLGRCLGPEDTALKNASIYVLTPGASLWKKVAETDLEGCYAFSLYDQSECNVFAISALGAAPAVAVSLNDAGIGAAPSLHVRGYSIIEGKAHYPDNKPIGGLKIEATGVDGSFRIMGLAPEDYFIWAPDVFNLEDTEGGGSEKIQTFACKAGDRDVMITIDVHQLKVNVVDTKGFRIPKTDLYIESEKVSDSDRVPYGMIIKQVAPGALTLTGRYKDKLVGDKGVLIKGGDYLSTCELILEKRSEEGSVRLVFLGNDGKELIPLPPLVALFTGAIDGFQADLTEDMRDDKKAGFVLFMFPDDYDLLVMPSPEETDISDMLYLPATNNKVTVVSKKETVVTLQMKMGGRLRFEIALQADDKKALQCRMEVVRKDEKSRTPIYYFIEDKRDEDATSVVSVARLKSGISYLSTKLFEKGEYLLKASIKGYQPVVESFIIRPGEITDLKVTLEAE